MPGTSRAVVVRCGTSTSSSSSVLERLKGGEAKGVKGPSDEFLVGMGGVVSSCYGMPAPNVATCTGG